MPACGEGDPRYSLASEEAVAPRAGAYGQLDWTVASVVPRAIARREPGARLGGVVLGQLMFNFRGLRLDLPRTIVAP